MNKNSGNRRDRSRSPNRISNVGRRREKNHDRQSMNNSGMNSSAMNNSGNGNVGGPRSDPDMSNNMMNAQMMMTNMYPGNMMMAGGMYPNMMMPNAMMGSAMMPSNNMEMMPSTGMEMMPQPPLPPMDMSTMGGQMGAQPMPPSGPNAPMDMGMMGGMMMDPSLMGNMGMYPNAGGDMSIVQEKKEIILKHCKLTPPEANTPPPPRRAKPPGCRTIFVGGLPDNISEKIVREVFENYGRIHILRLSTKNFCHIRFDREGCVDAAMQISGYQIRLLNKDNQNEEDSKANSGWLHVDYALSRDDQNEYERRQRQAMRAQEQQMQQMGAQQQALASTRNMYSGRRRSPSPVLAQPFSNAAVGQLAEKIKSEEHFAVALPTLISWLERGECSKKNSNQFYSMIQATNSHIRRLYNEKVQAEDELMECKERIKNTIQLVIDQLEQVAKVFAAATHQRVWDHFTKPQRKNIETWQKMSQEFNALKEEFMERFNEDNEFNNGYNPNRVNELANNEELHKLKLENDSLKFQLEAYKNEVDVIKADAHKELEKFKAQYIARQVLQGNPPLPQPMKKPPPPPPLPDDIDDKMTLKETVEVNCGEAKLIGIMSAFLQVHPQGASLDYVVSYVRAMFPAVSQANVHHVLQKHDEVFKRTTSGVGANIEHRWSFVAFQKVEP